MHANATPDFSLGVEGIVGICPAGERWAEQQIAESKIPVLSCEGPRWVKHADKVVVIDGCFLKCHGRALKSIVRQEKIIQFDAFALHKKYKDVFLMEAIPESERKEVADQVAKNVLAALAQSGAADATTAKPLAADATRNEPLAGPDAGRSGSPLR